MSGQGGGSHFSPFFRREMHTCILITFIAEYRDETGNFNDTEVFLDMAYTLEGKTSLTFCIKKCVQRTWVDLTMYLVSA